MTYDPRVRITGEGPPLVFVPGIEGTGLLYYRQVERLARDYRVVTFRLRDAAADMDTLIADLEEIVRQTTAGNGPPRLPRASGGESRGAKSAESRGLAGATIVGESFGGALALSYALTHPHTIDRLVILNSFAYLPEQSRLRLAHRLLRATPWAMMRVVRRLVAPRMHSAKTDRREIRKVLQLMQQTTREGYLSRLSILQRYDVRARLGELAIPTLFLAADCDHLLPSVQHAEQMASLTPNARMRILKGHGHTCLVAPDVDLREILTEWLKPETARCK